MSNEGATPEPQREADCEITKVGLDGVSVKAKIPHIWHWVWVGGTMTDEVRCGTCNKTEKRGLR